MLTDTIKWIEINWKVLDTINDNRSIIGSTEEGEATGQWKAMSTAMTMMLLIPKTRTTPIGQRWH
jgi:hypothetical protein